MPTAGARGNALAASPVAHQKVTASYSISGKLNAMTNWNQPIGLQVSWLFDLQNEIL